MPQTSSFFELAALLVPVLMLSGYVTARLKSPKIPELAAWGRHRMSGVFTWLGVILMFGLLPMAAEVLALSAVMSGGDARTVETWIVAITLAFGVLSLAVALVWPWIRIAWLATRRPGKVASVLAGVVIVIGFGYTLKTGVDIQLMRATTDRAEATQDRLKEQLGQAGGNDYSLAGSALAGIEQQLRL
jgi:hypothetical protein